MPAQTHPPPTLEALPDRILLIDDEAANLRLLTSVLEREGYGALELVSDPRKALSAFERFRPDLVLLDLHMPGMSGFAVLEQIRAAQPAGEYLPILVLTGDTSLDSKRRALSTGATDFLGKPFEGAEVGLRIRNLLETRRLHLALRGHNQELERRVAERTRELEAALRRAEAARVAKEQFLGKMSHELRTPLNAISGALELFRARAPDSLAPELRSPVEMAARNVDRMAELINEILYLQSIEQGNVQLDVFPVHPAAVVGEVAERAEGRLRARGLALHCDLPRGIPPYPTDPQRLADILWRLTDNAIRFTPAGEVRLRVVADAKTGEAARIEVSDTGVGIEPDRLQAVFEPFEQADNSSTRRYEGAGIGLSVCRALCDLMGYRLVAQSTPGVGSTFTVLLRPPAS